jgi:hypothetical protein
LLGSAAGVLSGATRVGRASPFGNGLDSDFFKRLKKPATTGGIRPHYLREVNDPLVRRPGDRAPDVSPRNYSED